MAGRIFSEVNLRLPNDKVAARDVEVLAEEEVALEDPTVVRFVVDTLLGFCLRICRAFANAFS